MSDNSINNTDIEEDADVNNLDADIDVNNPDADIDFSNPDADIDANDSEEVLDAEIEQQKKSNWKRNVFNVVFLVLVFGLTMYGVFRGEDYHAVIEGLKQTDLAILIVPCIVLVLAFVMLESVIIKYIFNTIGDKPRLTRCFLYSFVGFFFSLITPSASGGQPAQLIFMRKDKLSIAHSTIVLILVTIGYKLVLVVLGGVTLIIGPESIMSQITEVEFWIWLGIILNVIAIVGMLIFVFVPSLARKILVICVKFLNKIKILKDKQKWLNKANDMMEKYETASGYLKSHKVVLFNVFLLSVIQRVSLFFVTVVVYWSFHLHGTSIIDILLLQCLISVGADMLPLPGGMGITERLFLAIFQGAFGALTLPAMILSRGFSFYIQLFICAIMTVVAYIVVFWIPNKRKT